jgi:5-methylcytosine-specific restriction protein A
VTPSWRTDKRKTGERGYGWRWQQARLIYLQAHPLCVMCEAQGKVNAAQVVDHRIPHKGDETLFWDETNWQSLCKPHHDGDKQASERSGTERTKFDQTGRVVW